MGYLKHGFASETHQTCGRVNSYEQGRTVRAPDYLLIGHITQDLTPWGPTLGGTATYAARTAQALGYRVAVLTSASPDLVLDGALRGIAMERLPAPATTTFENIYTPHGRRQIIHAVAAPLGPDAVPPAWRSPRIVHLGPLARECDPALVHAFPGSFIGITPQGWLRTWDEAGRVSLRRWEEADQVLPYADAVVLSPEDVGGDEAILAEFARLAPILVVTLGAQGCRVHVGDEVRHIPVTPQEEVDPTGAGDIFAAAFFIRLHETGDPWEAARFANQVASRSVRRPGLEGTPTPEEIATLK